MFRHSCLWLLSLPLFLTGCLAHLGDRPLSYRHHSIHHHGEFHGSQVAFADYVACDDCGTMPAACDSGGCGTTGCDRCDGGGHLPLGSLAGQPLLHRLKQRVTCGDGCGEVYIGEWISTPPKPDPCDFDGQYTGFDNGMSVRPYPQPVRNTLRRIAGIRFLGTRYPGDPGYAGDFHDESWSEDWVSGPYDASHVEPYSNGPVMSPGYAAAPAPTCNCQH